MTVLSILAGYLLLGAVAGTMAGLFGVGGGLIIVPALVFAFGLQGVAPEIAMHLAVGTSLATIVVTRASSALGHFRKGSIHKPWFMALLPDLCWGLSVVCLSRITFRAPFWERYSGCLYCY